MEKTVINNGLYITLPPRLTAANTSEVRQEIYEAIDSNSFNILYLDAKELQYTSSSGLRIILELVKKYKDMWLINVNLEVMDVLDMTGLKEIVNVRKALRKVSIDGCKQLGMGKHGTVYRYNEDTIIKLYTRSGVTFEDIDREHILARRAFVLGVPTAISFDVVMVGEYYGAMYELVGEGSVLDYIYKDRGRINEYLEKFAEGMKAINTTEIEPDGILVDKRKEYAGWIADLRKREDAEFCSIIEKIYNTIPEGKTLVHGDYHMGNVMMQEDEILIIDMDTLGYGNPIFEMINLYASLLGFYYLFGSDSFYDFDEEERLYCWNQICNCIYREADSATKDKDMCCAEILGLAKMVRYGYRKGIAEDRIAIVKKMAVDKAANL